MDGLGQEKKPLVSQGQIYALLGAHKAAVITPALQEEEAMLEGHLHLLRGVKARREEPQLYEQQRTMHQQSVRRGSPNGQGALRGLCMEERQSGQGLHMEECQGELQELCMEESQNGQGGHMEEGQNEQGERQGLCMEEDQNEQGERQGLCMEEDQNEQGELQGPHMEERQTGQGELQDCTQGLRLEELCIRDRTEEHILPEFGHRVQARLRLTDTRYPQALPTEESPRRRARSLPETSIPEAGEEEEEASLICCCKLKKRVQFADSLGLTLASVKHFLSSDEPMVPPAVLARLQSYPPSALEPCLEEPASSLPVPEELLARLGAQRLCLEQVSASNWGVRGSVLVRDTEDGGQVKIRYTFNEWLSYLDCPASAPVTPSPGVQRFLFTLCYPPTTSRIHFAICYNRQGQEAWDNNQGNNYMVTCQQELIPDIQNSDTELDDWEGTQHW